MEIVRSVLEPLDGINVAEIDWGAEASARCSVALTRRTSSSQRWTSRSDSTSDGNYRGLDGLVEYLRAWLEPFSEYYVENLDYIEAGDCVLVPSRQWGVGRGSGTRTEIELTTLFELRDGKIARIHQFDTLDEALEAAGLRSRRPPLWTKSGYRLHGKRHSVERYWAGDVGRERCPVRQPSQPLIGGTEGSSISCSRRTPRSCRSGPRSEGTTYWGRDAASQYVAAVDDSWESLRWELDEVREAGDFVLGLGHIRGRGRGTGATIDTSSGWVAQFRDGLMTRFRTCTSREEAFKAAGLSE